MPLLVSVIVPVYRVEAYLDRCVQSLLGQTLAEIEILLIDDGSPDRCGKMCDAYAAGHPDKVRVLHKENGGLSDARNAGLKMANGKYVLFVDSDDYILPESCAALASAGEALQADIVVGNATVVIPSGETPILRSDALRENTVYDPSAFLLTELSHGIFWRMCCMNLYRTDFLREQALWFVKGLLHEDEEWTPRVVLAAGRIVYCSLEFYKYIIRPGSITQSQNSDHSITDGLRILRQKLRIYETMPPSRLRSLLLDDTVRASLHLYTQKKMYPSPKWRHALDNFPIRQYACRPKTQAKAWLFCLSKGLYCRMVTTLKKDSVI